ncbi:MAG: M48 family metalloprotease [bacterium]|nr:M48 family metalloprotease [bacterium]
MLRNVISRFHQNGYGRQYRYYVLQDNSWNAFATSGFVTPDLVCVLSGLLNDMPNEDALAGVVAHEIIHNDKKHGIKKQTTSLLIFGTLWALNKNKKEWDTTQANLFATIVQQGFSRVEEYESDREGLFLMAKCGYNPDALIQMWRSKVGDIRMMKVFLSHPPSSDRIQELEKHKQRIRRSPDGSVTIERDFTDTLSPMEKRLYNATALATYTFGGYFLAAAYNYDFDFSKITARNSFPDAGYYALAGFALGLVIPTDLAGTGAMFASTKGNVSVGVGLQPRGIGLSVRF